MLDSSHHNVTQEESDTFLAHVLFWLSCTRHHNSRAVLEEYQEVLLNTQTDIALTFLISASQQYPDEFRLLTNALGTGKSVEALLQKIETLRYLLDDIRARGRSLQAIRDAYVNLYGGFVLDIPLWLREVGEKIIDLSSQKDREQTAKACLDLLEDAISKAEDDQDVPKETVAWLYEQRALIFPDIPYIEENTAYTAAMYASENALKYYTQERYPLQWANNQRYLGILFGVLHSHKPEYAYLKKSIAAFNATLHVYTFEAFPERWAKTQKDLANSYCVCMEYEQKDYTEQIIVHSQAALQVYTRDVYLSEWGSIQALLGSAYLRCLVGDKGENIERAIAYHKEATLAVRRSESSEAETWAWRQLILGESYLERIRGERKENIELAIACFRSVLQIFVHSKEQEGWATAKADVGYAYLLRVQGDPMSNIETAIMHLNSAAQICTRQKFPLAWAKIQNNLGLAYFQRRREERAANIEQAITYFVAALQCYKPLTTPLDWAMTQMNLGSAYLSRLYGNRAENLGLAIWCYREALETYKREGLRAEAARVQSGLGAFYSELGLLVSGDFFQRAIASCKAALEIYTNKNFPLDWARTQFILGHAYLLTTLVDRKNVIEEVIDCCNAALQVYSYENAPVEWSRVQWLLGDAYFHRTTENHDKNLAYSVTAYQQALRVFLPDVFTSEYGEIQNCLADAEAARGNLNIAHEAYLAAQKAEEYLVLKGIGISGRATVLTRQGESPAIRHAILLARMGKIEDAAIVIERGRAYSLSEAFALNAADPNRINDSQLRARYQEALRRFLAAQATINKQPSFMSSVAYDIAPYDYRSLYNEVDQSGRQENQNRVEAYRQAQVAFDAVVDDIRRSQSLDGFLLETLDHDAILQAAACGGPGHALLYLAATLESGMAIAVISAQGKQDNQGTFSFLELPALTYEAVHDLVLSTFSTTQPPNMKTSLLSHETDRIFTTFHRSSNTPQPKVSGGFLWAQEGSGLFPLSLDWSGSSFQNKGASLHKACIEAGQVSTLDLAAQEVLDIPKLAHFLEKPLSLLSRAEIADLKATFGHSFLQYEIERCLRFLADAGMRDVVDWLHQQGVTSVTLIPCGWLAAFPLAAVEVLPGRTFGDLIATSVVPSMRSLLHNGGGDGQTRSGVSTFGDPRPTNQALEWGEAEAHTIAKLARLYSIPTKIDVQLKAERHRFIHALQHSSIVHASCHGIFIPDNPLDSALKLAQGQKLTLGEMLSHEVDLQGLRLLILSACQTATMDLRRAVDEVHSFTTGTLQAGVHAVLAPLWAVDDLATYLLIVRFAQEWLPRMEKEPPAKALIRAQKWLRELTYADLLAWKIGECPTLTGPEKQDAGSETPDYDPWQELVCWLDGRNEEATLTVIRGHGTRMEAGEAAYLVRKIAKQNVADNGSLLSICPYAHPIFWAGFQVNGW